MNEKSLVGRTFKTKSGKEIKVTGHDQVSVSFDFLGHKGKGGKMDWNQFKKEVYENKAVQLLSLVSEVDADKPPIVPAKNVPSPEDEFEMKFKHHDKDAVAYFYVWAKGSPNKTTYQHYDPGEAPELELVAAHYDDGEEITDLTPEAKEALTIEAAEKYAELDHDTSADDEYDRANDR